jgi:DNA-binding GntR family transcriptional regulator
MIETTAEGGAVPQVRRTRAEALRAALADDIVSGRIRPGTRLDETVLAERFGVSRTPVREALKQLAATGLAELRPHRGVIVAAPSPERLVEMFEALAELEAVCARLSALKMGTMERSRLQACHEACRDGMRDGRPDGYDAANRAFHDAIYDGSHNAVLADSARSLRTRLAPFSRAQFRTLGRLARSFAEHDTVVRAILRGDGDGAAESMRRHVLSVRSAFDDYAAEVSAGR